ncbi:MAG TPA: alpha/beta hydrolase [Kofleriaceae bacterium]
MAMRRARLGLLVLCACGGAPKPPAEPTPEPPAAQPAPAKLKLFVQVIDGDEPTILLEAGGGADSASWEALPQRISEVTGRRVIAYDRAGFGKTPLPADDFTIAEEIDGLHSMLDEHGAKRVVIVAASYGALFALYYTKQHPQNVAGLVLLDPMNADFVEAVGIDKVFSTVPKIKDPKTDKDRAIVRMVEKFPGFVTELRGVRWPASVPAVVISAARMPFSEDLHARWRASHVALAKTAGAQHVEATNSGHDIAEDEPEVVITAVKRVLAARAN